LRVGGGDNPVGPLSSIVIALLHILKGIRSGWVAGVRVPGTIPINSRSCHGHTIVHCISGRTWRDLNDVFRGRRPPGTQRKRIRHGRKVRRVVTRIEPTEACPWCTRSDGAHARLAAPTSANKVYVVPGRNKAVRWVRGKVVPPKFPKKLYVVCIEQDEPVLNKITCELATIRR